MSIVFELLMLEKCEIVTEPLTSQGPN